MNNENTLSGYFKVYRSILNWEWFKDRNTLQLFICLLALASFKDGSWQGVEVKRGDVICSVNTLSQKTGLSTKAVRVALNHLKRTNEVAIKGANKYSVITLVNYDFYQTIQENGASETASNGADEGQTKGKQGANKGQHRKKVDSVNSVNNVKVSYAEFVTMTEEQYQKLIDAYGEKRTLACITKLDLYKGMYGKKYSSDYHAILKWVIGEVIKEEPPAPKFAILEG